jgi:hypothetical protein
MYNSPFIYSPSVSNKFPVKEVREVNYPHNPDKRVDTITDAASASVGILGSASLLNPALAPLAATAGLGLGIYKLGESFKLW